MFDHADINSRYSRADAIGDGALRRKPLYTKHVTLCNSQQNGRRHEPACGLSSEWRFFHSPATAAQTGPV
jgi:hypothetical protein